MEGSCGGPEWSARLAIEWAAAVELRTRHDRLFPRRRSEVFSCATVNARLRLAEHEPNVNLITTRHERRHAVGVAAVADRVVIACAQYISLSPWAESRGERLAAARCLILTPQFDLQQNHCLTPEHVSYFMIGSKLAMLPTNQSGINNPLAGEVLRQILDLIPAE
jgi:hypothetical protein